MKTQIVAHRGYNKVAPENTFVALELACQIGIDYIEVDIFESKEGGLYVFHDDTVERTTNGQGEFVNFTNQEIETLDAGSWFSDIFTGQPVPKLEDFLKRARGRIKIYADIKTTSNLDQIIDLLKKYDAFDDAIFFCEEDEAVMQELYQRRFELKCMMPYRFQEQMKMNFDELLKSGYGVIELTNQEATQELVSAVQNEGLQAMIWHKYNDTQEFLKSILLKPDLLNVDAPDTCQTLLELQKLNCL